MLRKYLKFLQKKQIFKLKKSTKRPTLRLILGAQSSSSATQKPPIEPQQSAQQYKSTKVSRMLSRQLMQPKHWGNKHYYLMQVGGPQSGEYIAGFVSGLDHTRTAPSPQDVQLWLTDNNVKVQPITHAQFPRTKQARDLLNIAATRLASIRDPHVIFTISTKRDFVHPDFYFIEPHPKNQYKNRKFIPPSYTLPKDKVRNFRSFTRMHDQLTRVMYHTRPFYVTALFRPDHTIYYGVAPTAEQSALLAYREHPEPGLMGKPHWLFMSPTHVDDNTQWPKDIHDFHGPMHKFSYYGRGFTHHVVVHKLHDGFQAAAIALPLSGKVSPYIVHANGKTSEEAIHNALSQLAIEYVRANHEPSKAPNFHSSLNLWLKRWINQLPTITASDLSKFNK